MSVTVVRYKTKPDQGDVNQTMVEKVFAELAESNPAGLRYATFRLADGVSFVHVASVETADGSNPLFDVKAFQEFSADIAARCDEPPAPSPATMIGSFNFAGGAV